MIVPISNFLVYIFLGILMGTLIINLVPKHKKPLVYVPKPVLLASIVGLVLCTFIPLAHLIHYMAVQFELDFWTAATDVLFDFRVGQGWLWLVMLSVILFVVISISSLAYDRPLTAFSLLLTMGIIFALGWATHTSTLDQWGGFLTHSGHVLAVSMWVGVLLVVAWFSKNQSHWLSFLSWFTPLAIACVLMIIALGIVLMQYLVPEYTNSLVLPYGQSLLIKQLFIVPLLAFALMNGFIIRQRLKKNPHLNPTKWVRAESIVVLFIFAITSIMTEQAPPHEVRRTLQFEDPSPLFSALYQGAVQTSLPITLEVNTMSIILVLFALVLAVIMVMALVRQMKVFVPAVSALFVMVSIYLALMTSVPGVMSGTAVAETHETIEAATHAYTQSPAETEILLTETYAQGYEIVLFQTPEGITVGLVEQNSAGYRYLEETSFFILDETDEDPLNYMINTFNTETEQWPVEEKESNNTFVTFGLVHEPQTVQNVEIQYEEGNEWVSLTDQAFIHILHVPQERIRYPVVMFLNQDDAVVGWYTHTADGMFCH